MSYESVAELGGKIDWEGGITEFATGYGLDIADLPPGTPENIKIAFLHIQGTDKYVNEIQQWLDDHADDEEPE